MQFLPSILSGALLSGVLRIWATQSGPEGIIEVLHGAVLLPIAFTAGWPLRKYLPAKKTSYLAGDVAALLFFALTYRWPAAWALAIPISAWAMERGKGSWPAILLTAALCRLFSELLGSSWIELAVAGLAIVPAYLLGQVSKAETNPHSPAAPLWRRALHGAHWTLLSVAAVHVLQILSPVARASSVALLLAAAVAHAIFNYKKIRITASQRTLLFALAWISLPGLLDRGLYPLLSNSMFWILGWVLVIAPWGVALGAPARTPTSWLGVFAMAALIQADSRLVTDPRIFALALGLLLIPELFFERPLKAAKLALTATTIVVIGLTQVHRLSAGPDEQILDSMERLGRTLTVIQPSGSQDVQLRDRFHLRVLSSESSKELRRQGLLPFRLHNGSPLKRLLIFGATNPFAASSALELPGVERLTWVDPDGGLFAMSRWWISREAAANTKTRNERVISSPSRFFKNFSDTSWDAVVLSPATPWSEEGSAHFDPGLPALVRDRIYADGIAIQWIQIQQWSEPTLTELVRRWNEAFEGRVELWRSDLSPYSPYLAIVARGPSAPMELTDSTLKLPDRLLGAVVPSLSLRLTNAQGLRELLLSAGTHRPELENAWYLARQRLKGGDARLDTPWLIRRFSSANSRLGGPSEGGLRYTHAALLWANGEADWTKERSRALALLGFDPTEDLYRELFPAAK